MKERGLICNQRTVLAILAGATQDRRPVKGVGLDNRIKWKGKIVCNVLDLEKSLDKSPFGVPGDRLYVRETMQCIREMETGGIYYDTIYSANGEHFKGHERGEVQCDDWFEAYRDWWNAGKESRFIPSIHMPRWASRITLEVKRVWVERVQDISERDATAEGIGHPLTRDCKKPAFLRLWESIYGPGNPWVWCCEYEREA